jgi:hypothetical protein
MELPVDIFESIILHADIDTISNLCLTSTLINNICNNKHVWINKFIHNHFPIMTLSNNWIHEYIKINDTTIKNQNIIDSILNDTFDIFSLLILHFRVTDDIIHLLPTFLKSSIMSCKNYDNLKIFRNVNQSIFINVNNYRVRLRYCVGNFKTGPIIYKEHNEVISIVELQSLLFNLLYYYPSVNVILNEN